MAKKNKMHLNDILAKKNYVIRTAEPTVTETPSVPVVETESVPEPVPVAKPKAEDTYALLSNEEKLALRCKNLGIESIELTRLKLDESAVKLIDESVCTKHCLIPIGFDESRTNSLRVAMADPMDVDAIDDISIITNMNVVPLLCSREQIAVQIDKFYGEQQAMAVAEEYRQEFVKLSKSDDTVQNDGVSDAPIVMLVRSIIEQAAHRRASDIHIEPMEDKIRLRYRIDGVLVETMKYDISLLPVIISRIKIISGLDISEKRIPQDGRATAIVDGKEFDIRVSTMPTVYGEKVVMRLNAKKNMLLDKRLLGFNPEELEVFDNMLKHPHGIILVTGPTGSGKSTTLYTALSELNTEEVNIITVEDPVEVNIGGVNQVQINERAEVTFATVLRSILRQDPDIIMIGEIRDGETAEIAIQASITGHLVVSTLHTNSTVASISRLLDMGVESYLMADSLVGIIAQRLTRRLCECKIGYEANESEKAELKHPLDEPLTLYRPSGCPKCNNTGYYGRMGIYETLPITATIRDLIARRENTGVIRNAAIREGMRPLRKGLQLAVINGITSISEMRRIECEDDDGTIQPLE